MSDRLRGKYCIAGIGESEFGKLDSQTAIGLKLIASKMALDDAGIAAKEVDGIISQSSLRLGELLGMMPLSFVLDLDLEGATAAAMVQHAVMALEAGMCRAVLCVLGGTDIVSEEEEEFYAPYGMFDITARYAMAARRHMHRYGTTSRQLGLIAVAERTHARLNPIATLKEPMTIDDHQGSPWAVEPLRMLDCPVQGNGAGAFLVVPKPRAKDLKNPTVFIMGMGQSHPHREILDSASLTSTGAKVSGEIAFRMAGLSLSDVDVAELADPVTYAVLVQLEDYGFCKKGEAGAFLETEGIELNKARIPVNTHGGLLSCANVPGILHITEAVKQLRNGCGQRQVPEAGVALVSGSGGVMSTHVTLILRK